MNSRTFRGSAAALFSIFLLSFFSSAPAKGEGADPIPVIAAHDAISIADKNSSNNILLVPRTTMQAGDTVGKATFTLFCTNETNVVLRDVNAHVAAIQRGAYRALQKAGYKRFDGNQSAFDSVESKSADFKLGATIKDYRDSTCRTLNEAKGTIYFKVFWELFSSREQRVVFSTITEGSATAYSRILLSDLIDNAATNATNNLLASQEFVSHYLGAQRAAAKPDSAFADGGAQAQSDAGQDSKAPLTILNSPHLEGGVTKNIERLQRAVVTVETSNGWGSGFYIDIAGYLLTNLHVVNSERFVRVRLSDGTELVGEVLRKNSARDVALIKTREFDGTPLSIRLTPAILTEDVYAIGSPYRKQLAGTVTKGIVSPTRKINDQTFLQSDVAITHGNSGGPLIDATGAVIGISTRGIEGTALNFFIPVADALCKLSIEVR